MLKLFFSNNFKDALLKSFIFVDTDVLLQLYSHPELTEELANALGLKKLWIHPFTEFEFLRGILDLQSRKNKTSFVENALFLKISEELHASVFPRLIQNAFLLSHLYASEGDGHGSSFIDLILGGLLMAMPEDTALITCNKKDFPSCIFDILGVITMEFEKDSPRAVYVISFNREKYDKCSQKFLSSASKQAEANKKKETPDTN